MKHSFFNTLRKSGKVLSVFLCLALAVGVLTGCTGAKQEEKITVSMMHRYLFPALEALVESKYPDIDIVCEREPYLSEQIRRLEKGVGPELIITNLPRQNNISAYLLDISDSVVSTAYEGTTTQSSKMDGKTYLLPLPGTHYGYVVNETLFMENGIPLPTTNQELVDSLAALRELGVGVGEDQTNFAITSDLNFHIGLFYAGYMTPDFLGTVEGDRWLSELHNKQARFSGTVWENCFTLTDALTEIGAFDPLATSRQRNLISYRERLASGNMTVIFGDTTLYNESIETNQQYVQEGTAPAYSYRMLPVMSDSGNNSWFLFAPTAYIGINKSISQEKQDACRRVLELISTPEGQEALIDDLGGGVSCLRGYKSDNANMPKGVEHYAESGYVYNVRFPERVLEKLGTVAVTVLNETATVEDALHAVDDYYYNATAEVEYDLTIIGSMAQDLLLLNYDIRRQETALGNFVADCVAYASGAPIAVINSGGVRGSFYRGVVYGGDPGAVCPYDNLIVVVEISGSTLCDMLRNSASTCTEDFPTGRFLQLSGLRYVFDSSKPEQERFVSVSLADGTPIDPDARYQVAINNYMAGSRGYAENNGDGYAMLNLYDDATPKGDAKLVKETTLTYRDAIRLYLEAHSSQEITAAVEGRLVDQATAH